MIGHRTEKWTDEPGEFYKSDGVWYCTTPNGHLANLANHAITEHEDGTISVAPSIKVSNHTGELWHGFLERGVWRDAT